jgi:general secretion pathway protein N
MQRSHWLIVTGAGAFLLFLLALLPARVALGWLLPETSRIAGAYGTLWTGSLAAAEIGTLRLGGTRWRLSPWALFTGRLAGDVETSIGEADAGGAVSIGVGGRLSCTGCRYEGPIAALRTLIPVAQTLGGNVRLDLQALDVREGWPRRIQATAALSGVPIVAAGAVSGPQAPRGDFEASVSADPVPEDGTLTVAVKDAGGPLRLEGALRVKPPGAYEFAGRAQARADAPPEFVNALSLLGPRGPDGSTEISVAGSF